MDPQIYDQQATHNLSFDKQNIVRHLSDMFYGYSLVYIRSICEASQWNVDLCIDKLIGGGTGGDISNQQQPQQTNKVLNYSKALQKSSSAGAVPKSCATQLPFKTLSSPTEGLPTKYDHVYKDILKGYKVLVLMRGPPGSGKSYLSKAMAKQLMPNSDWKDIVLSADDYFFDARGRYRYQVQNLEDAHKYCQTRAREKMQLGYSPVIIDNTNNELWEMMPYVCVGVENGYIIEMVEPVTKWRNSAGKLAMKNIHNVPKQKIQRMMDRFEIGTTKDLLALCKETKYTVPLPQLRTYPSPPEPEPMNQDQSSADEKPPSTPTKRFDTPTDVIEFEKPPPTSTNKSEKSVIESFPTPSNTWLNFEPLENQSPAPRSPRQKNKNKSLEQDQNEESHQQTNEEPEAEEKQIKTSKPLNPEAASFWGVPFSARQTFQEYTDDDNEMQLFPTPPAVWQSYEQEATNFWGIPVSKENNATTSPAPETMAIDESNNSTSCGLLQLLKEGVKSINVPNRDSSTKDEDEPPKLVRHRIGCANENDSFIALRQIYPNKPNAELWDLFVKCNGSIDWTVDILLKDEDSIPNQNAFHESMEHSDNFDCYCDRPQALSPPPPHQTPTPTPSATLSENNNVKPQRQKLSRNRTIPPTAQILEVKEAVEKSFVLGDEHYSSHVKKIRNKRNATEDLTNNKKTAIDAQVQTDELDDNENSNSEEDGNEDSEIIEINLSNDLIRQLSTIFASETTNLEEPKKYKTNVFMPKALARELYVLWMESVYNQQEEQRQAHVKEDEEFARLLKNPKYQNLKQPPENIKELLDMEYAWMIYKKEQEQYNGLASKHPNDLASHLTRMKLCEIFPNIPRDTLLDILAAHNNKFSDTVEVLKSSIQPATVDHQVSAEVLIEKARTENEMLKEEATKQEQKILKTNNLSNNNNNNFQKPHSNKQQESPSRPRSLSPEEAKRLALSEFEETRNYAAHHCQLRAECYQKAKEAIQRGNSGVAVYYSQIANLHKRKIDIYNHRAANCIMEVHDLTQNNPDFIDLHYLHVVEAIACLDIFLDRHIAKLRSIFRSFKYAFIITGRGLHSTGGVSMIKTRVKSRLKERNLKWSEVNPGLLKVKIFSASKYSKNL